jgi:hypothetical protein
VSISILFTLIRQGAESPDGRKSSLQIESSQAKNQVAIIGGIAAQKAELENLRLALILCNRDDLFESV